MAMTAAVKDELSRVPVTRMSARKAELAAAVLEGGGSREKLSFEQADLDTLLAPG